MAFTVRILTRLEKKVEATRGQERTGTNPFLPYDEDLFVADISDTHVCLMNKFNVLDHHLLIVTREFEEQESALTLSDFEALWMCLAELDGLAFYNWGTVAGASQRHKHLQLAPLPLGAGPQLIPIDPLLERALSSRSPGAVPELPFAHALARVDESSAREPAQAARTSLARHGEMMRALGCEGNHPYNLLVTRRWMLMVPRTREHYGGIPVNALGYAGSLLVLDRQQLDLVRRLGPMAILREVAAPRDRP